MNRVTNTQPAGACATHDAKSRYDVAVGAGCGCVDIANLVVDANTDEAFGLELVLFGIGINGLYVEIILRLNDVQKAFEDIAAGAPESGCNICATDFHGPEDRHGLVADNTRICNSGWRRFRQGGAYIDAWRKSEKIQNVQGGSVTAGLEILESRISR